MTTQGLFRVPPNTSSKQASPGELGCSELLQYMLLLAVCRIFTGSNLKQLEVPKSFCKLQC